MNNILESRLPILWIVVPCYNEEKVIAVTIARLTDILQTLIDRQRIGKQSRLLLVDDGSRDATWSLITSYFEANPFLHGLKIAHNVGHQNALHAGLMQAKNYADLMVSIDADLQDDPEVIFSMVEKAHEGNEVVYGVRNRRAKDSLFKRQTAQGFYRLMEKMGIEIVYNHADFRLMSRRVVQELEKYEEQHLFLRGILPKIGFRSTQVTYERAERFAGESKYPLKKMLAFAFDGMTSMSVTPIRFITLIGVLATVIGLLIGLWSAIALLIDHGKGTWPAILVSLWIVSGIQLLALGLLGEYIGRIYQEAKRRPKYHIETILLHEQLAQETPVISKFNALSTKASSLR